MNAKLKIDCPPLAEQVKVVLPSKQPLSGVELAALAQGMVEATDPDAVRHHKADLINGFYGDD